MAISLLDNLSIKKKAPDVARQLFDTVADMVAFSENYLPAVYECNVVADGKRYRYMSTNTVDAVTGKWREVTADSEPVWYGTSDEWDDLDKTTLADGTLVYITDDSTESPLANYYNKTQTDELLDKKLDVEQTVAEAGKVALVGADGNLKIDNVKATNVTFTIDGSTKMLQTAIDNGEIGGGDVISSGTFVVTTDNYGKFKVGNLNKYLTSEIIEINNMETNGYMTILDCELDTYGNYIATSKYVWGDRPLAKNKTFKISVKWKPITKGHQEGTVDIAGYIALWGTWEAHGTDSNILCASNKDYVSVYNIKVNSPSNVTCDTIICNSSGFWRLRFVDGDGAIYVGDIDFDYDFISATNVTETVDKRKSGIFEHNSYSDIENIINQMSCVDPMHNNGVEPATFIWFSDIHADQKNLERIVQLRDAFSTFSSITGELTSSKFKDVICSGDMAKLNASTEDMSYWDNAGARKFLMTMGNHDSYNASGEVDTASNVSNRWSLQTRISEWGATSGGSGVCYYYKDYASSKIRMIILDCMHLDSTQLSWLTTTLNGAKTLGYSVVCVSHYYATQITDGKYQYLDTSFNQGHSMTNDNIESAAAVVNTFINGGGSFICWLCGHEHRDNTFLSKEYPKQIVLGIEMATHYTQQIGQPSLHIDGTKSQDAFDIISFDTNRKLIRVYRVGNDEDQYLRRRTSMCIDYEKRQCLYNESASADFSYLQTNPRYVLYNWSYDDTSDVGGWVNVLSPNGTVLDRTNCAGVFSIISNNNNSDGYISVNNIMTNSGGNWRAKLVQSRDNTQAITNTTLTLRVLAYVSRDAL